MDLIGRFIKAPDPDSLVFVRNTTEGINLVAAAWGGANLGPGDEMALASFASGRTEVITHRFFQPDRK